MATSLKEHLELAEHHLMRAKHIARASYMDELARELERIYREVIIGIEDMHYNAERARLRVHSQHTSKQHTSARSQIS